MKRKLLYFLFIFCFIKKVQGQLLITNMPDIIGDTIANTVGNITAFENDTIKNRLYIAGEFVRVGTSNRKGFAVIDLNTGKVLNTLTNIELWSQSLNNSVKAKLKIFNNRLYIGGDFDPSANGFLFSVSLVDSSIRSIYNNATISDFEIYNSKIYTSGKYYNNLPDELAVTEMDTLGNITWQKYITHTSTEHLTSVAVRNNILFVGGYFNSFGGVALNNIAKVDLSTHSILSWQLNPAPGPTGNLNCYSVSDIVVYPNDVLVNLAPETCGSPPNNVAAYSISSGFLNNQIRNLTYNYGKESIVYENDTCFWYANNTGLKLYGLKNYVAPWSVINNGNTECYMHRRSYLFTGGNYTSLQGTPHKGIGVFCLGPAAPKQQSTFAKACQGQSNLFYMVTPVKYATSYVWTYSGSGVTINGTGSSVTINFSSTATSGTLKICAKSYCGATGDTLFIPFTVYPLPNINAGSDIRFTCSHNVDTLKGSSTTPGATFAWYGPSYSNVAGALHQVTTSITGGNYILYVTDPISGCKNRDTAKIFFDTIAPVLNHNLATPKITCTHSVVTLNATSLYPPGDILHWSGNSFSQNNPATVSVAGIYTLTITSGTNDCVNKDTFLVSQNTITPNLSAPISLDTITCARDSVQLTASSTNPNAILYWKRLITDSILNNSYTHLSGSYTAHALDTTNGCSNQLISVVHQYTTLPVVQLPAGNFSINCSVANVVLNGTSPNAGAILNWTGANNFSSPNPATVTQAGYYCLHVTNPQNGCETKDSIDVTLQNILLLNSSNDTTICNGTSATLHTSPVGGTPGFTYSWSNSTGISSNILVAPGDTTAYIVTVTDNAGCVGKDTILVKVPLPLSDSVHTYQPCDPNNPNGQIQAFGTGGVPPYQYALNNGAFQNSGVFSNLNFGNYNVYIKDTLGCNYSFTSVIDQSSVLPAPDFIMATNQTQGDTFVVVDISNPRPDSVQWILPAGCSIINNNSFAPQIINADTGVMQITMVAWFGTCKMQLTRNITVIKSDTSIANDHNNNGIASLVLYPNPNNGQFTVDVTLHKKQSFALFIFDALGNELLRAPYINQNFASTAVNLNNPAPGSYILKVIAEYDSKTKTFLINTH